MPDFNIEIINFEPAPDSTLIPYFNQRLTELSNNPKVTEIKSAKLAVLYKKPPIFGPVDYLFSTDIPMPGRAIPTYHICEIVISITNIECTISYYTDVYFQDAIDYVIDEALSRCHRYF